MKPEEAKEASIQLLTFIIRLSPEVDELEEIAEALARAQEYAAMIKGHILGGWVTDV